MPSVPKLSLGQTVSTTSNLCLVQPAEACSSQASSAAPQSVQVHFEDGCSEASQSFPVRRKSRGGSQPDAAKVRHLGFEPWTSGSTLLLLLTSRPTSGQSFPASPRASARSRGSSSAVAEPNRTSHSGGRTMIMDLFPFHATRKRQASGGSQKQLLEKQQSAAEKKAKLLEEVKQKRIAIPSLDLHELKEHELKEVEDLVSIVSRAAGQPLLLLLLLLLHLLLLRLPAPCPWPAASPAAAAAPDARARLRAAPVCRCTAGQSAARVADAQRDLRRLRPPALRAPAGPPRQLRPPPLPGAQRAVSLFGVLRQDDARAAPGFKWPPPGLRTAPHLPPCTSWRLRPLLRPPERRLSSSEACRRPSSPPQAAPKMRMLRLQPAGAAGHLPRARAVSSPDLPRAYELPRARPICLRWKLDKPDLLITVNGGAQNFERPLVERAVHPV
jgi:hypothetical protein